MYHKRHIAGRDIILCSIVLSHWLTLYRSLLTFVEQLILNSHIVMINFLQLPMAIVPLLYGWEVKWRQGQNGMWHWR